METLPGFLQSRSRAGLLPIDAQFEAAERFAKSFAEVEAVALKHDLLPARYQRNRSMLSLADQRTLLGSCVGVVGCGGLGGYVLEELARLGVGRIVAIDPDLFEEHNLNRQLLSTVECLDQPKVSIARERLNEINPVVEVSAHQIALDRKNGESLLQGAQVVVDCLDRVTTRRELAEVCSALGVPLVHGAIAGWYGQVSTILPGSESIDKIYAHATEEKGVEQNMGNPSFTPAVVASFEVAEVCKLLLGKGALLDGRVLHIDLYEMETTEISF